MLNIEKGNVTLAVATFASFHPPSVLTYPSESKSLFLLFFFTLSTTISNYEILRAKIPLPLLTDTNVEK